MKPIPHPLTIHALKLYGPNTRNAAHWLRAVRYMRHGRKSIWVMDGARVDWGHQPERKAA